MYLMQVKVASYVLNPVFVDCAFQNREQNLQINEV